jgi:transposase
VALSVEGCTGWRYVVEEILAAGLEAHVAEPADTQAARGRKKRAKTDRADARLQRELLQKGELPESWIPPMAVLEWRERTVLYKSLMDHRRVWIQRIHAELFQHGVALPEGEIRSVNTRLWLAGDEVELSPAAGQRISAGYRMIDATDAEVVPLKKQIEQFGRRQPACRALADTHYGIGPLTAVFVWAELGDCRRFSRSMQVVRHTGLDVLVDSSDRHRAGGYLCRQGPATLRWALFEAGKSAARPGSPDYEYYQQVKKAHDGKLAAIAMARKLARRCYHTLRNLDPEVVYAMPDA